MANPNAEVNALLGRGSDFEANLRLRVRFASMANLPAKYCLTTRSSSAKAHV